MKSGTGTGWNNDNQSRTATVVVAASNSSAKSKQGADYICDGVADEVEIQAAINSLSVTGDRKIVLMGDFTHGGTTIALPSNINIELNGTITFTQVLNGSWMFQNADQTNGNTNITFKEGILKGDSANQTAGTRGFFNFIKVKNSVVDCYMQDLATPNISSPYEGDSIPNTKFGFYVQQDSGCTGNKIINRNYPNARLVSNFSEPDTQDNENSILISDCNSGWTLTQNASFDTTHFISGIQSLKLTANGNDASNLAQAQFFPSSNLDLARAHLHFLVYLDGTPRNNLYDFGVQLVTSSGNSAGCEIGQQIHINKNWFILDVMVNPGGRSWSIQGDYDPSNISRIILKLFSNTETTQNAWIGRVWATYPNNYGLVTFTFDDSLLRMKDYIIPILENAGFAGVNGVNPTVVGDSTHLSLSTLTALKNKGWDIVSHTNTHKALSYNGASVVEDEICKAQEWLNQNGFQKGARFLIMPKTGSVTSDGYDTLKKHHVMGRSIDNGINTFPYFNQFNVKARCLDQNCSLSQAKAAVDASIMTGGWTVFFCHTLDTTPWGTTEISHDDFQSLVNYVKTSGCRVVTFSEVYDKYKNLPVSIASFTGRFDNCLASSTTAIHSAVQDLSGTHTDITQPDVPRCVSITQAGTGTPFAGSVTVTGYDAKGRYRSASISVPASNTTTKGTIAWTKIDNIVGYNVGTNQTISVGVCDKIGLSKDIIRKSDVLKVLKNGTTITVPVVDVQNGTVDCSTITANDTFIIRYRGNNNAIV